MRLLPTSFNSHRFRFQLLQRDGMVALLQKARTAASAGSYEVVIVQMAAGRMIAGKFIPGGEHLPCSEEWGKYGWTYADLASALRKYHQLAGRPAPRPARSAEPRGSQALVPNRRRP